MEDILNFLNDNYVYAIGIGLIILIMLIGLVTAKKKPKKEVTKEAPMANINEVNTGEIKQVAATLEQNKTVTPEPEKGSQPVGSLVDATPSPLAEPEKMQPIDFGETISNNTATTVTPAAPVEQPVAAPQPAVPAVEEVMTINEPMPSPQVETDKFDKTEIIDLTGATLNKPEQQPAAPQSPFVTDSSQFSGDLLNGEETVVKNDNPSNQM